MIPFTLSPTGAATHFTRFEVQRCIRIVNQDGEYLLPIDARQDESTLEPIKSVTILPPLFNAHLIQTEKDGVQYAVMAASTGELYKQASEAAADDYSCFFSPDSYAGISWRVLGFVSANPETGVQLNIGDDEAAVRAIGGAFQSMLEVCNQQAAEPTQGTVRVVVDITRGAIHEVYATQPVDIVFLSTDEDDIDESQSDNGYRTPNEEPVALWMQGYNASNVEPGEVAANAEHLEHYFFEYTRANRA